MTSRFRMAAATALAISWVGILAAQQTTAPREAAPGPAGTVTVTGCVQRGEADGSIAGTALGTSVPPSDAGPVANLNPAVGFMLTDATPVSVAREAAAGNAAVGTTGATQAGAAARTSYALEGNADELMKHLGKRMEVTGSLVPAAASGAGTKPAGADDARAHAGAPTATGGGDRSEPLFRTGIQRIKVTAIKAAAGDCGARK